jgi:hypothetical protein
LNDAYPVPSVSLMTPPELYKILTSPAAPRSKSMTKTKLIKLAVRKFILDKILEVTRPELDDLAAKHDLSSFHVAECFDYEAFRVEKFFCFPQDELGDDDD